MNLFNEQAQLFMVASLCLLIGIAALYGALGLYGMALNRLLHWIGVHAAIFSYIRSNRAAWWCRFGTWFERHIESRRYE